MKHNLRWFKFFTILVLLAFTVSFMPRVAEAQSGNLPNAKPSQSSPIPIKGPNGETWYLVPFNHSEPVELATNFGPTTITGCQSFTEGIYIDDAAGYHLGYYAQKIDWCYNGSTITSKSRTRWGTVYYATLQFIGHIGSEEAGGVGYSYYRAWTQGSFCAFIPGAGCVWYVYPCVDQYVYGDGSYWGDAGG